jgi:hypothetical protein
VALQGMSGIYSLSSHRSISNKGCA